MSTEHHDAGAPHRRGTPGRRHGRFMWAVIGVLAVLAAALGAATQTQGPRLEAIDVNTAAVTERAGQTLTIQANQPVNPDDAVVPEVSVVPEVPVDSVVVDGSAIAVTFAEPLDYATTYTVTATAEGRHTGRAAELRAAFTTLDPEVATLVRGAESDHVAAQRLQDGDAHEQLAVADRIQEYALLDDQTVVVTLDDADRPAVESVPRSGGDPVPMIDSGIASVRDLRVEPRTRLAGFIVDDLDQSETFKVLTYTDSLLLYDMNNPGTLLATVVDEQNRPLEIAEWRFVPGTTAVLARTLEGELVTYDPALGSAATPATEADWDAAEDTASEPALDLTTTGDVVTVRDESGERELFRPAAESSRVGAVCAAPNGEVVAIEVFSGDGAPDGYPVPGFTGATVSYVRVADGTVIRSANGLQPDWCRQ